MTTVAKSDLQKDLSQYLDRVSGGEEVIVMDSGKPVARIVPIATAQRVEAHIAEMVRNGQARPPLESITQEWMDSFLSRPKIEDPDGFILKALLEDRESGR
jgi:prevent-host-death family protein